MAAKAINQNDINDIVKFYSDTMKTIDKQKIDVKQTKKSLHTFSSVSSQIIEFYDISNSITQSIVESGVRFKKDTFDAQKSMIESINTIITAVNSFNSMKLPNMFEARINMWKLKKEVDWITKIFLGPGGIAGSLNAFDNLKAGREHITYDSKGNVVSKYTVEGLKPTDVVKGFSDIVNSITTIVEKSSTLSKNIIKTYVELNLAWPRLIGGKKHPGIIDRYVDLIKSEEFKILQDKNVKTQINAVIDSVKSINSIVQNIDESFEISDVIKLQLYDKFVLPKIHIIFGQLVGLAKDQSGRPYRFGPATIKSAEETIQATNSVIIAIGEINISDLIKISVAAALIDKVLTNVKLVISKISEFAKEISSTTINTDVSKQIADIKSIVNGMLSIVKEISLLALALIPMSLAIPFAILTLELIGLFIKVAIKVINRISTRKKYEQMVITIGNITKILGLMLLMVGMVLTTLILISLSLPLLIDSAAQTLATFAVIALVTFGIAWLAVIIDKILSKVTAMWEGLLMMIALIGVMMIVTGTLLLFALTSKLFFADNNWLYALAMFGVVGVVTLAIAGLGYLIVYLLPGIAAFAAGVVLVTIAIGAMLLIGVELLALTTFNFDEDKRAAIKTSTVAIIGAAKDVMDALFNGMDDEGNIKTDNSSPFVRFFRSIFKGTAFMIEALAASFVMVMTTVSVTMMLLIGLELETLAKININKRAVIGNVNSIMGTANSVIDAIFEPGEAQENPGGSKFLGALKHIFTGLVDILEIVVSVGKMALIMIAIGMVRIVGGELNWIAKFDTSQLSNAAQNVHDIMSTADAVVDAIFSGGEEPTQNSGGSKFFGFIKNTLKNIGGFVESVLGIGRIAPTLAAVGMVALLAQELKSINDISNEVNKQQILDNTDLILTVSDEIVKKVFNKTSEFNVDENKIKSFNKVTDSLDKFIKVSNKNADNLEKNINNTIKFVDKIDSVKIENLKTAANMFEKMADFSKSINGNFEGLADVIEDKIMPLLEKLNETFENTNKVIENGASIPSSAPATTAPVVSAPAGGQGAQVGAQAPVGINYSAAIDEIRQELSKIHDALTDGSQITRIDD